MIVGGALLLDRVANSHVHHLGVIAESVPNRTLSGIEEGGARISQRPKPLLERFGYIEDDVLPAERGNVGEQLIGQIFGLRAKLGNGYHRALHSGGCKPKPPKIPSPQLQPRHDGIQIDDLSVAAESVVPV
jgi:hypothetical protein